jgi:release factor glutamine methyltransferase
MSTSRDLLDEGIGRLRGAGLETPRLDAELLLGHVLGVDRTTILAHPEALVGDGAATAYRANVERRAAGEPVAYIRGIKEFHGIALTVDPRVLIPRPETELLVDLGLAEAMARLTSGARAGGAVPALRILDVGTGSGAVAVALAVGLRQRRVPVDEAMITAVDISPDALDLARDNAVGQAVGDRLSFATADLAPSTESRPWDLVLANLPYVRSDALGSLPAPTTYEPPLALDGGPDGLEVIERLLARLPGILQSDGVALLEIGADQGTSIGALVAERLTGWSCTVMPDLAGLPRVARIERAATAAGAA